MTLPRPRQPVEVLIAKGKKHLSKAEIEERKSTELKVNLKNITIPDYLPKKLQEEFKEISDKLSEIGIMTELDEDCLARYVLAKNLYLQYTSKLTKPTTINSIEKSEAYIKLQDKAFKQCQSCANSLGLTISSRCKLVIPKPVPPERKNKFDKFIK